MPLASRYTTLGPFIVNNLGPKLRQTHPETRIIFGENAQWSAILGFIMGSKNYVRDILNLNPKITNFPVIAIAPNGQNHSRNAW